LAGNIPLGEAESSGSGFTHATGQIFSASISSSEHISSDQDARRGKYRLESRLLNFLIDLILELFFGSLLNEGLC
jgi:hypothetical protein